MRVAGGKGGTEQWQGGHHWRFCQRRPMIVLQKGHDRAQTMTRHSASYNVSSNNAPSPLYIPPHHH